MSDDRTNPGPEDGKLVSLAEAHEVAYWTRALGCTALQLEVAVRAVGHSAAAVRDYLGSPG